MTTASLQQRTPAWHAARKGKLTASNVGAALGLCPWTSRQVAFNRAMGLDRFQGKAFSEALGKQHYKHSPFLRLVLGAGNDATRWGTKHEADGVLAYSAHTGNLVQNTGLHVHPDTSWLAGSPDGLIGSEGMLEVKCPYWMKKNGSRLHKEIPAHYYMQMNLCLEICGRAWCDFISWSPEAYVIYRVTRDPELHDALTPHYLKFFAAMQRNASSPPQQADDELAQINELVAASMSTHVNYDMWRNMDTNDIPPSPPLSDSDTDDEPLTKYAKTE